MIIIESIEKISAQEIEELIGTGVCYVRIPDELKAQVCENLASLESALISFFNKTSEEKCLYAVPSSTFIEEVTSSGYVGNGRCSGPSGDISGEEMPFEQFIFLQEASVVTPFLAVKDSIEAAQNIFRNSIAIPLLNKVLGSLEAQLKVVENVRRDYSATFSPLHFNPENNRFKKKFIVHPHKDGDFITVLATKPGLEVWFDEKGWVPVLPKPGYLIVNLGALLEVITLGRVRSCLHRVRTPEERRISFPLFVMPNFTNPVFGLDSQLVSANGSKCLVDFIEEQSVIASRLDDLKKKLRNATNLSVNFLWHAAIALAGVAFGAQEDSHVITMPLIFLICQLSRHAKAVVNSIIDTKVTDYLQYTRCPAYADQDQAYAYQLGWGGSCSTTARTSSLYRYFTSFLSRHSFSHASFWNAGFIRSLLEAGPTTQKVQGISR